MCPVFRTDAGYSPDVEIDEHGRLVYARNIAKGETIVVPMHMIDKAVPTYAPFLKAVRHNRP